MSFDTIIDTAPEITDAQKQQHLDTLFAKRAEWHQEAGELVKSHRKHQNISQVATGLAIAAPLVGVSISAAVPEIADMRLGLPAFFACTLSLGTAVLSGLLAQGDEDSLDEVRELEREEDMNILLFTGNVEDALYTSTVRKAVKAGLIAAPEQPRYR